MFEMVLKQLEQIFTYTHEKIKSLSIMEKKMII